MIWREEDATFYILMITFKRTFIYLSSGELIGVLNFLFQSHFEFSVSKSENFEFSVSKFSVSKLCILLREKSLKLAKLCSITNNLKEVINLST